jgi:hypothetical protein
MITLEKGDKLTSDENLEVFEGGTFEDTDLVMVNVVDDDFTSYQYQAYYIKNGKNKDD